MDDRQKITITTGSWLRGVAVVTLAYAFFMISEFILVIITAIIIASSIEPAITWGKRRRIPRLPMVLFVYTASAVFLAGLFYFLLLPLLSEMSSLINTLKIYSNTVNSGGVLSEMFKTQNLFAGFDTPVVIRELSAQLNSLSNFMAQGIFSGISKIFGGLLNFALILVLSFYLVAQEDGVSKFLKIVTPLKYEEYVVGLWRRSQIKIGRWMQGQLLSSALVMLLVYIGLLIVGIPHALLLAVLAGVLELIPLFGATIAAIPAIFVGYISDGATTALVVTGLYIVIQQFESNLIYPIVVKQVVGVPPIISIMALVIGGTLAGFLGVLISVPVAAVIMELFSDLEERKVAKVSSGKST